MQPRKHLSRIEEVNHARFLTFSCYRRLALFSNDRIKTTFAEHLIDTVGQSQLDLVAWVIMPEHIHLLLTPQMSAPIGAERFLRRLKTPFARQVLTRWRELDGPILSKLTDNQGRTRFWQPGGGYDRSIASEDELHEKVAYIEANPVRRGLVLRPNEYQWSSAGWSIG